MNCTNCGSPVNGQFCNNCGTPVGGQVAPVQQPVQPIAPQSDPNNGTLVVNRKNSFVGIAINIAMTLDGQPFQLSNGQQLAYSLVPGVHTVTYKVWCRRKKTVEVNVVAGGQYLIDFTPDWLWGGFKLSKNSKLQ